MSASVTAATRRLPAPPGGPSGSLLPASVIAELVRPLVDREGPGSFARRCGLPARRVYAIVSGEQAWVTFDTADRIVTLGIGDPSLWYRHPGLVAVLPPLQLELDEEPAA